jgi:hypothetical protein
MLINRVNGAEFALDELVGVVLRFPVYARITARFSRASRVRSPGGCSQRMSTQAADRECGSIDAPHGADASKAASGFLKQPK